MHCGVVRVGVCRARHRGQLHAERVRAEPVSRPVRGGGVRSGRARPDAGNGARRPLDVDGVQRRVPGRVRDGRGSVRAAGRLLRHRRVQRHGAHPTERLQRRLQRVRRGRNVRPGLRRRHLLAVHAGGADRGADRAAGTGGLRRDALLHRPELQRCVVCVGRHRALRRRVGLHPEWVQRELRLRPVRGGGVRAATAAAHAWRDPRRPVELGRVRWLGRGGDGGGGRPVRCLWPRQHLHMGGVQRHRLHAAL